MSIERTKSAKSPAKNGKIRYNVCFSELARRRGEKLANLEMRSFSNFIEVLIDREYLRRFPAENSPAPKPA